MNRLKFSRQSQCLAWATALLLLVLPAETQAQFSYTNNNGAITITGYTGSGAVMPGGPAGGLPEPRSAMPNLELMPVNLRRSTAIPIPHLPATTAGPIPHSALP